MRNISNYVLRSALLIGSLFISGYGQDQINWGTNATNLRGRNGQQFTFVCPAAGTISASIWGADLYTDDTSICTAAVHAGRITVQSGGTVTIEIRPGASGYAAALRNGVSSRAYGAWSGSFIIVGAAATRVVPDPKTIDWGATAIHLRGRNGQQFSFNCPAGGVVSGSVWGTDLYTDDTSICTAAVHAGFINSQAGGAVTVEIRPGAASYTASSRNGITSRPYGGWHGSFVLIKTSKVQADPTAKQIGWGTNATDLRGRNGQQFRFNCPAGGAPSAAIWGTNLYTDDTSICTAAVHMGLIAAASGGSVTIEVRPGASSYQATDRNGVASRAYGGWSGSYVFITR